MPSRNDAMNRIINTSIHHVHFCTPTLTTVHTMRLTVGPIIDTQAQFYREPMINASVINDSLHAGTKFNEHVIYTLREIKKPGTIISMIPGGIGDFQSNELFALLILWL